MTPPLKVVALDPAAHQAVQALLPWHAMGTLDRADALRVEAHLAECPRCQADLRWERGLVAAHRGLETPGEVERGFAALRLRIEARRPRRSVLPTPLQRLRQGWQDAAPWLRRVVAVQAAVWLGFAAVLGLSLAPADYRALGGGAPAGANLVVKFRPETPIGEVSRTVTESGAAFVGGPTASEAYLLAVTPDRLPSALARLRAQPSVTLAESLGPAP